MTTTPAARDERELFEAAYLKEYFYPAERWSLAPEKYRTEHADIAWRAWQARSALAESELAEVRGQLDRFKSAYIEWQQKTEWIQTEVKPKELGKHRADVLRERLEALTVHPKTGFCGDPYVHDCGRSDCPRSDSYEDPQTSGKQNAN